MGQRLIIKNHIINPITKHQSDANVIYYHWSAYTESSLIELQDFITNLMDAYDNPSDDFLKHLTPTGQKLFDKYKNNKLIALEKEALFNLMTYYSVSGVSREETLNHLSLLTTDLDRPDINRNDSLLGITPQDQKDILFWSESTLTINWVLDDQGRPNLEKTTFDFNDLFWDWTTKEYDEDLEYDDDLTPYEDLPVNPYQVTDIPLTDLDNYRQIIADGPHEWYDGANHIYMFIE